MTKHGKHDRRLNDGRQRRQRRLQFERFEDRIVLSAATAVSPEMVAWEGLSSTLQLVTAEKVDVRLVNWSAQYDVAHGAITETMEPLVASQDFFTLAELSANVLGPTSQHVPSLASHVESNPATLVTWTPAATVVQPDNQGGYLAFARPKTSDFSADFIALDGADAVSLNSVGANVKFETDVSLHLSGWIVGADKNFVVIADSTSIDVKSAGGQIRPTGVNSNSYGLVLYEAVSRFVNRFTIDPASNFEHPEDAAEELAKIAKVTIFDPEEGIRTKSNDAPKIASKEFDPIFGAPRASGRTERLQADASALVADAEHMVTATSISFLNSFQTTHIADEMPRSYINLATPKSNAPAPDEEGRQATERLRLPAVRHDGGAIPVSQAVAETQRALDAELFQALAGSHVGRGRRTVASHQTHQPLTSELARSVAFDLVGAESARVDALEGIESPQAGLAPTMEPAESNLPASDTPRISRESERELAFARWPILFAASTGALLFDRWRRKRPDGEANETRPGLDE